MAAVSDAPAIRHSAGPYSLQFGQEYYAMRPELLRYYEAIGRASRPEQLHSMDKAPSDWLAHLAKMVVRGLEEPYGHMDPLSLHSADKMAGRLLSLHGAEFEQHLLSCLRLRLQLLRMRAAASSRENLITLHDQKFLDFLCKLSEADEERRHQFAYFAWQCGVTLLTAKCQLPQRWRAISSLLDCYAPVLLCRCSQRSVHLDSFRLIGQLREQLLENKKRPEFTVSQSMMQQMQKMLNAFDDYLAYCESQLNGD